jgi:hypothetical protein
MEALWNGQATSLPDKPTIRQWAEQTGAYEKSNVLLESYKEAAIRALSDVEMPNLKGLLRRVIGKIFNELEIKGWCREIEQEHSAETAARRIEAAKEAEHLVAMPKVA